MSFPGGAYFLSFTANVSAWTGGAVVEVVVEFTDGSTAPKIVFGEPRVVSPEGQRFGTLATADLTDEARAIRTAYLKHLGELVYYGNLTFFSRSSQSAAPAKASSLDEAGLPSMTGTFEEEF